jgi:hypothetical protein
MFPTFGPDVSGVAFDPTKITAAAALQANALAASGASTGIDFGATSGTCYASQSVGTMTGSSPTLAAKIQQSADNSTWSDVSGAGFTQVSSNINLQTVTFTRTMRYLRYNYTVGGSLPSIPACCLIVAPNQ